MYRIAGNLPSTKQLVGWNAKGEEGMVMEDGVFRPTFQNQVDAACCKYGFTRYPVTQLVDEAGVQRLQAESLAEDP